MSETGLVIGSMSISPIIQDTLRVHIAFRGRVVALALIVVSDGALALEQIAISEVGMSLVNLKKTVFMSLSCRRLVRKVRDQAWVRATRVPILALFAVVMLLGVCFRPAIPSTFMLDLRGLLKYCYGIQAASGRRNGRWLQKYSHLKYVNRPRGANGRAGGAQGGEICRILQRSRPLTTRIRKEQHG